MIYVPHISKRKKEILPFLEKYASKIGVDKKKLVSEVVFGKKELVKNLEIATDGGTSDARFIKDYCEVLELGLINRTLHQVDEYVLVDDLKKLTDLYFLILEIYFDKVQ